MTSKDKATQLLSLAGITINGSGPTDIKVYDETLYDRVFATGSVAIGEGYMDKAWEVDDLAGFFTKIFTSGAEKVLTGTGIFWYFLQATFTNMQNRRRAFEVGEAHYDIGNDLYEAMLDKRMVYTCGYWSSPTTPAKDLDDAQEQKLDLVCRKIGLKQGDTVLDVGCGWGSFAKFAAEKYGAHVVGVTVSAEQAALARERCKGLPVEIRVEDYRDTVGKFDYIISLGMFEHVGPKNYRAYMQKMETLLKDDGLFLLHTIGWPYSVWGTDPWIHKYIFPNGVLPSVAQIGKSIEKLFIVEDWHNFGPDYDKTLTAWFNNFDRAWPTLKVKYSERFYRMWKFYLLSCAAQFRSRRSQLWQVVLSKGGTRGSYRSVR